MAEWVALGERVFFEYPMRAEVFAEFALTLLLLACDLGELAVDFGEPRGSCDESLALSAQGPQLRSRRTIVDVCPDRGRRRQDQHERVECSAITHLLAPQKVCFHELERSQNHLFIGTWRQSA